MAGHSKWANIKRRKESQDQKRSKTFSKLSRLISATIRETGSSDLESNPRLRTLVDQARAVNMPKENIERALKAGGKGKGRVESFIIEGYGPRGVAVLVEVATDNRQRTVQQVKNIFRRAGGRITEPGAVSFQFSRLTAATLRPLSQEKTLALIDGPEVVDFKQSKTGMIFYLHPGSLEQLRNRLNKLGAQVVSTEIMMKPSSFLVIDNAGEAKEVADFLDTLKGSDNVLRVFSNVEAKDG